MQTRSGVTGFGTQALIEKVASRLRGQQDESLRGGGGRMRSA